jgi:hypothetical protein
MSRSSHDVYVNGVLISGFDYANQAWVKDGFYVRCGHPESMTCGCYGRIHADEPCTHRFMDDIENYRVPPRNTAPRGWNSVQGGSSVSTLNFELEEVL